MAVSEGFSAHLLKIAALRTKSLSPYALRHKNLQTEYVFGDSVHISGIHLI
jgi:hypothetical protein